VIDFLADMLTLSKNWAEVLKSELAKPYIGDLKAFLDGERQRGAVVYPPEHLVFNSLRCTPFDEVKVVIMGQDPYHGPGQAHGLCFSVTDGVPPPPSLKNIYKELAADVGFQIPSHGSLERWAKQGVLLLNATLTVRASEAKSHYGKGWERLTDAIVEHLCMRDDPMVFILWGRSAYEKCERILGQKSHPHAVLTSPHPSPLSAHNGFFGCRHFSKTNNHLINWNKKPINWQI